MRIIFLKTLLIIISFSCYSQKQGKVWYFGNHAGLDFNSGSPIPLTDGATYDGSAPPHSEGTAVISDSSGALLFYTNGEQIWNRNHQVMPNGNGLLGNLSSTQAALILPQPGSNQYYYVFTSDDSYNNNLQYGFRYSVVDICLENGLGDVLPDQKNIKLLDTICEKITAVNHANGNDYWVIVHKYYSDAFYSYHLSSEGIIETVVTHIGSRHPLNSLPQVTGYAIGQLKASPNGEKLCIVSSNGYGIAEYFDFDKSTGVLSNWVDIKTDSIYQYYGVSFSPDNSKLYIACILNCYYICQYDLDAGGGNPDSVKASRIPITTYPFNYQALQLGTDDKIYCTRAGIPREYLGVINSPNNLGLDCNYIDSAVYLNGKTASFGLPNFLDSYQYHNQLACTEYVPGELPDTTNKELNIPNVFSPNADDINDTFIIENLPAGASVQIYNRWGALVAEWNKPDAAWDGRTKGGSQVSAGVYYYIVTLPDNERRKGFIEVIR